VPPLLQATPFLRGVPPAIRALLIQLVALVLNCGATWLLETVCGIRAVLTTFTLSQGVVAALLTRLACLDPWWIAIQLAFAPAMLAIHAFELSPNIYLAAFVLLFGLYGFSFRTQAPLFLSGRATWDVVAAVLPKQQVFRFVDVGSGFGGLILHLSDRHADGTFVGVEAAPLAWLLSSARALLSQNRGRFVRADFRKCNLADYDVVFAYLSPAAMPDLWSKARAEMRSGTMLLSYEFPVPGVKHNFALAVSGRRSRMLYGWHM
jgi:hypothetical protein